MRISQDELVDHFWCVEKIIHQGVELKPNTVFEGLIIDMGNSCQEDVFFHRSGMIDLPGFDTYDARGRWEFKTNKVLTISGLEAFKEIYEGEYAIHATWGETIELVSDKTIIEISRKY